MWNKSQSSIAAVRIASALLSMLLAAAVLAPAAPGQSLPSTHLEPTGGVDLTTGPEGVGVGLDAGDTGGVTVGAGQDGVKLNLRTTPKSSTPSQPADPGERVSVPRVPGDGPGSGSSPAAAGPPGRGVDVVGDGAGDRAGGTRGTGGERAGERPGGDARDDRVRDLRTAARTEDDGQGGVAPVFDLVDRIPPLLRAGLVALALIAIALWALWVRGRRRLEQNAYQDPDTEVANLTAFEQLLEREWQRAARYRRPLGLVLLDVEQPSSGGIPLLGERDARNAVQDISEEVRQSDIVARLAPGRFAVICPEAPQGSLETLAHALELRLEEWRLHSAVGFAERSESDQGPADLVARAASDLADTHPEVPSDSRTLELVGAERSDGRAAA
jgi:diguanylate cyclase (GGDEF)-like protein